MSGHRLGVRASALGAVLVLGVALAGVDVRIGGGLFPRFEASRDGNSFALMGAEANLVARISGADRDYVTAAIQFQAGTTMTEETRGFHFGEAYALVPTALRWPTLRVGQAVIPFGLLADYDIHTQIVQTPYARVLGLRIDPGIGVLGSLGPTDYWLWLSNGNGPYVVDNDEGKVITARIAPTFLLGDAEVTVGLSSLAGSMPEGRADHHGIPGPRSYAVKYRLGLDNTTDWGPFILRLEGVAGTDHRISGPLVLSGYVEARYALTSWVEPIVKADLFRSNQESHRSIGGGINVTLPDVPYLELQTHYERTWQSTGTMTEQEGRLATQLAITF